MVIATKRELLPGGLALKLAARSVCKGRKVATDYAYSTAPHPSDWGGGSSSPMQRYTIFFTRENIL